MSSLRPVRTGTPTHPDLPGLAGGLTERLRAAVASDPSHGGVWKSVHVAGDAQHGLGPGLPGWASSAAGLPPGLGLAVGVRLGLCILREASVLLVRSPQVSQHLRKPAQAAAVSRVSVWGAVVKCCPS